MLFIIVIGLIVAAIGFAAKKSNSPATPYSGIIKIVGFAIIAVAAFISSVVQINPGEIGVQKLRAWEASQKKSGQR